MNPITSVNLWLFRAVTQRVDNAGRAPSINGSNGPAGRRQATVQTVRWERNARLEQSLTPTVMTPTVTTYPRYPDR